MKLSEFEAKQTEKWRRLYPPGGECLTLLMVVARDVAAAEAAGVKWDPEEPELPERLGAAQGSSSGQTELFPNGTDLWRSERDRTAGYQEAARRYNLFSELEKLGEEFSIEGCLVLQRLRAILGSGK